MSVSNYARAGDGGQWLDTNEDCVVGSTCGGWRWFGEGEEALGGVAVDGCVQAGTVWWFC